MCCNKDLEFPFPKNANLKILCLLRPSVALVNLGPGLLCVSQLLLDLCHLCGVSGVLAEVVAKLDSWLAIRGGDFNDNVQRF